MGSITNCGSEPLRRQSEEPLELDDWFFQPVMAAANLPSKGMASQSAPSYSVQHKHRLGDCQGRLLLTDSGLTYESISDLSHSRKWSFSDIKTLKLENPYQFQVEPFMGNGYKLQLQGQGMESQTYKSLVDRITSSRSGF